MWGGTGPIFKKQVVQSRGIGLKISQNPPAKLCKSGGMPRPNFIRRNGGAYGFPWRGRLFRVPAGFASIFTARKSRAGGRGMPRPYSQKRYCLPPGGSLCSAPCPRFARCFVPCGTLRSWGMAPTPAYIPYIFDVSGKLTWLRLPGWPAARRCPCRWRT